MEKMLWIRFKNEFNNIVIENFISVTSRKKENGQYDILGEPRKGITKVKVFSTSSIAECEHILQKIESAIINNNVMVMPNTEKVE